MRFLASLHNPDQAKRLSHLLQDRHIDHELEVKTNTNWGDDQYGLQTFDLWIIDEDAFDQAWSLKEQFLLNPDDEALKVTPPPLFVKPKKDKEEKVIRLIPDPPVIPQGTSLATRLTILLCIFIFTLQNATLSDKPGIKSELWVPSPTLQWLLYDFPQAAALYTKVMDIWAAKGSDSLPPEGEILIAQAQKTPYWHGLYDEVLTHLRGDKPFTQGPLFEKIGEGQLWRFVTPALLHGGFLHILFNMLWLWMLGKEIERILGVTKYVVLMIFIAFFSNTAQYLMSGFPFLGFSGVISGLVFFIGERQRKAPWEGYTLQRSVYLFLLIYIFGLAALQGVSFLLEAEGIVSIPAFMGNTSHLAGAALGFLIGRTNYFAWRG